MPGQEKYRCFRSDDEGDHNTDKRLDKERGYHGRLPGESEFKLRSESRMRAS